MGGPDKQLFRQEPLETLSSPDKLNQLMSAVTAKDWIPLLAIGMLMATGVAWSVLGSVPSTVTGRGVLVRPRHMVGIETVSGGRRAWFRARAGDAIREGEVIGHLDQAELQQRIEGGQAPAFRTRVAGPRQNRLRRTTGKVAGGAKPTGNQILRSSTHQSGARPGGYRSGRTASRKARQDGGGADQGRTDCSGQQSA